MKEKELDQLIQQAIEQETELPEGLSQRLEQFVDKLPESSHTEVSLPIRKRPVLWVRYARIAAAIVVAVLFYYLPEDKETTLLCDCQRSWFKFTLSLKSFYAEEDKRERYILYQFLSRLYTIGVTVDDGFIGMISTVFSESHGAILQMCDYDDILLENDGHMNFYSVNDRCCDFVLTEIANHLNLKGKEIILDGNESKKIALTIQDFLGEKIDMILKVYSKALFYQLLELWEQELFGYICCFHTTVHSGFCSFHTRRHGYLQL